MSATTDHTAAIFFLVVSAVWFGTSNAAREIVSERAIYMRERMVNLGLINYVLSKYLLLSLFCIVQCTMLLGIVFFWLGFHGGGQAFGQMLGALVSTSLVAVALGLLLSTVVASSEAAMALTPIALIPQVVLGGLIVPMTTVPHLKYLFYVIPARWGFEASIVPERIALADDPAWSIRLSDDSTKSSAVDFVDAGQFKCATAQVAADNYPGAWSFTTWEEPVDAVRNARRVRGRHPHRALRGPASPGPGLSTSQPEVRCTPVANEPASSLPTAIVAVTTPRDLGSRRDVRTRELQKRRAVAPRVRLRRRRARVAGALVGLLLATWCASCRGARRRTDWRGCATRRCWCACRRDDADETRAPAAPAKPARASSGEDLRRPGLSRRGEGRGARGAGRAPARHRRHGQGHRRHRGRPSRLRLRRGGHRGGEEARVLPRATRRRSRHAGAHPLPLQLRARRAPKESPSARRRREARRCRAPKLRGTVLGVADSEDAGSTLRARLHSSARR
jgi:hypothetical protein